MPNLDVCGTIYPYPNVGDNPWGVPHIDWATAVSNCLTSLNTQVQTSVMPNPFTTSGDMLYANPAIVPTRLGIGSVGAVLTVSGAGLPAWQTPASSPVSVPIGTILAWCDFNGVLTLDANYRYMDGSVINAPSSPIDGETTDDLSGMIIVGYGTLGGGDVGTATYATTPVGNPNNQIALNHTHTHSHTHTGPSHTHSNGSLSALIFYKETNALGFYSGTAVPHEMINSGSYANPGAGATQFLTKGPSWTAGNQSYSVDVVGSTASGGTGNTGGASTATTSSSLSSTQSIQPRCQRYRYIIRVL